MKFIKGKSGIKFRIFEVNTSKAEAFFDGAAEDKVTQNSGGSDGVSGKMSANINARNGNRFVDIEIREGTVGDIDNFGGTDGT